MTGVPPQERVVLQVDLIEYADREDFDVRRWPEAALIGKAAMAGGGQLIWTLSCSQRSTKCLRGVAHS